MHMVLAGELDTALILDKIKALKFRLKLPASTIQRNNCLGLAKIYY